MKNRKLKNTKFPAGLLASLIVVALSARAEESSAPKFNALLQTWLVGDTSEGAVESNFRLRRAELKASGTPVEGLNYFVMIDAAKSITGTAKADNSVLQDLGVAITLTEGLDLTMGQFKIRTTAEGLAPSAELPLPERSILGRFLGDKREPGAMLAYQTGPIKAALMISNGQETNNDDLNGKKNLSARVDYTVTDTISVGAFTLAQDFSYDDLARYGFNLGYVGNGLTARFEAGYQNLNDQKGYGWMLDFAYNLDKFEPVIRYEQLKPNDSIDVTGIVGSAGLNYYLDGKKSKVQLAYSYLKNIDAPRGSPNKSAVTLGKTGSVFYLVFQAAL